MKGYWNQLRPLEKRLVVGVGAVVFVVLNLWFVVPHFSDWGKVQARMTKAQKTLGEFDTKISQTPTLQKLIIDIEGGEGAKIPLEEQSAHFGTTIESQAAQNGVGIMTKGRIQTTTNQNFFELNQSLSVQSKEQQLVDFLFNLGQSGSLIRVRDLNLHPDQSRQLLAANVKLVASYQRTMPVRGSSTTTQPRGTSPAQPKTTAPAPTKSTPQAQTKTTPPAQTKGTSAPPKSAVPGVDTPAPNTRPTSTVVRPQLPTRGGLTNRPPNPGKS